ncbi:MAG TPA: alpha/beta fold hydrolase, partial [Alphaproteobacteria bacterium]|nr:alpha/beta fold hydrolase [Alphaproteobacteria bacterium]
LQNLLEDLERGDGELKISTTDYSAFAPGRNLAITPGKIVYENDLMQLIQYTPTTPRVFGRPVLVIPPWINKYYILDMRPDNSFLRWLVAQGHTVFTISWVNPDRRLAKKRFEDYLREGILKSLEVIGRITGEPSCNAVGYCLGGTLLSVALAFLAAKGQSEKITSATFLTTLIDFEESGELKLFIDDDQLALLDREMAEKGVLEARALQKTFSLLRSNDLIWSFVVNNYLMGKEPFPFDLLYWNDDSTNMPAAMHSFYLRKMYRDNLLTVPGGITVDGVPIDLKTIRTPAWVLSTREDHIAPWKATYAGARLLGGPATFTLAASGHIAGVVNPPEGKKYCFWTSAHLPEKPEAWLEKAQEKPGSWWPEWEAWLRKFGGDQTDSASRIPGTMPGFKPIEDAPGRYVKVRR